MFLQHLKSYQDGHRLVTLWCCPTRRPDHQHHDLISHSITLSEANQYLPSPNNAECLARKRQVSILSVIGLTRPRFILMKSESPRSPKMGDGRSIHSASQPDCRKCNKESGDAKSYLLEHITGRLPGDPLELEEANREPEREEVPETLVETLQVRIVLVRVVGVQQGLR